VVVRDLSVVKPEVAEYFADSLICGYSSLISINKIYGDLRSSFRVGKETVSSLFDRAEETYFAFLVEIFDKSLRRRRMNPKKLYVIDTGYVRVRGCEYSISKAMENAVFLELKRRGVGDIYYWKEYGKRDGREVDFVVARNFSPLELIQVTYAEDKVERREVEALKKAREELKAKRCTVVTWDYEGEEDGIKFVPLWRWLLE
jgi:Predicted ATPase (AAA+ superfamily)